MMKNLTMKIKLQNGVHNDSKCASKTTSVLPFTATHADDTSED